MPGPTANIIEIFSSLQGEGPHTGEPMTFVRFAGCSLKCKWCDTKTAQTRTESYRVELKARSQQFAGYLNPITVEELNRHLSFFSDPVIAVTGGEPLEQVDFLSSWLPTAAPDRKILLETNGVLPIELERVASHVDIISMDIKLPSSTGRRGYWDEHAAFLSAALRSGKEMYVKLIVTSDTTGKDLQKAIRLITSANRHIPVIIQPASKATDTQSFYRLCHAWLPNAVIMGQAHKENGWL